MAVLPVLYDSDSGADRPWAPEVVLRDARRTVAVDRLLSVAFRDAPIGMILADIDGQVVQVNQQLCAMLGYTASELVCLTFADLTHPDDLADTQHEIGQLLEGRNEAIRANKRVITKSGRVVWVLRVVSLARSDDGEPTYLIVQIEDVSREREARDELSKMAYTDLLTGLGNRATFMVNGERLLSQGPLAVLLIDLDDFKKVNDSFGHHAGDEVLVEFARRLLACAGTDDTVVRLGGDEFVVFTVETDLAAIERLSQSILDAGSRPFQVGGAPIVLGISVGVAHTQPGCGVSEVLRRADLSLYSAKRAGKGRSVTFDARYHPDAATASLLEDALREAIAAGGLRVEYQPVYRIADQALVGFEALCRWTDPARGVVPPDQFIPIAEQTGLIHGLGTLVLRRACAEIASLSQGSHRLQVAVNVSVHQLSRPDFVSIVRDALTDSGLAPALLTLEVTESALSAPGHLDPVLVELRSLGVGLAIDDFGTGYSSLHRLRNATFQTLKIDRSFVSEITEANSPAPLTAAAIALGHAQGADTIAEGVETSAQLQRLRELGCEYAQGFLLSRPLPFDAARQLADTAPAPTAVVAAGHPQRSEPGAGGDPAFISDLLGLLQASTGLDTTYVTSVDWTNSVQRVEIVHSAGALDIPEGFEVPWQKTLCRVALLRHTPVLTGLAKIITANDIPPMPIETYVSVPLQRRDGSTYGTLCGVSTTPTIVEADTVGTFEQFGKIICRFLPGEHPA